MLDLSLIYATTDDHEGAELRCQEHPDWYADADGTNLPDLIKAANWHVRDVHRAHVPGCSCREDWLTDQRCIPTVTQ